MAGATAATAAGVSASQGSTITINVLNNYISGGGFSDPGGNHLNADLTGDGHPDLTITGASFRHSFDRTHSYYRYYRDYARARINGVYALASWTEDHHFGRLRLGSRGAGYYFSDSLTGSIPIFFKDLHINGGAPTEGLLEVSVFHFATIQLDSFTYNTPTPAQASRLTVPDQGSSLALLAMGAGGVLALRRWRAAQGRS